MNAPRLRTPRCDQDNHASIRTLERVGFSRTGDVEGQQLRWRLEAPE